MLYLAAIATLGKQHRQI